MCDECVERRAIAEALVVEHRLGPIYGTRRGVDLVDAALAALDVLRLRGETARRFARTRDDARGLVDALAHVGSAATWAARFAPIIVGDPTSCAPKRWAHVPADIEQNIRVAFRDLVHQRAELPFPFTPPAGNGALQACGLCGVGTLRVKPSDAGTAWGEEYRLNLGTLGGRNHPAPVTAHLCPRCRGAVRTVGAVGMGAVEVAVLRHLGFKAIPGWRLNFQSLRAWSALKPGTLPNPTPWAHLDSAALTAALATSVGAQRLSAGEGR
jgi:hypothetical protein